MSAINTVHVKIFYMHEVFPNFNKVDCIRVIIGDDKCYIVEGGLPHGRIGVEMTSMYLQFETLRMLAMQYAVRWISLNLK